MAYLERHYVWSWDLKARPEALWPLVSDTDRFNRDCGLPPFEVRPARGGEAPPPPGVRRLRSRYLGMVGEWEEREFEWVRPVRFAVERVFSRGPVSRIVQSCELSALPGGGTRIAYEMRAVPASLLGVLVVPASIGLRMRRAAGRVFAAYDAEALREAPPAVRPRGASAAGGTASRLSLISARLVREARQPGPLVERLREYVSTADDQAAAKMRPYEIADEWGEDRRATLDLFLHATREGMLGFSWEVLCPHCRGSKQGSSDLSGVSGEAHCDTCGIDFTANFDQSIELTFVPDPSVRRVTRVEYCLGGPQVTPHIVAQKRLGPGESLYVAMTFPEGRYRARTQGIAVQQAFRIGKGGAPSIRIDAGPSPAPVDEPVVSPDGILNIQNVDTAAHLVVIESVAWSDRSVTASDVTSRQVFRDLFSRELLRQGERISVGTITIVFTDLKNSTQLYREIGDAPAFGRVLSHFDVIKSAVAAESGAIVKTMGDAVMAVFVHPAAALRAMKGAQGALSSAEKARSPFALKCSIHQGPCLAINQNDRLDYFGTTVNVGARLCALSTGADIVVSGPVLRDPEVSALLADAGRGLLARADASALRGIGSAPFDFWRITG